MGKMMLLMVTAMGLLSGCHGNVFKVDARFTAEEQADIESAEAEWQAAGAEPIDFVFGQKVDAGDKGNIIVRTTGRVAAMYSDIMRKADCDKECTTAVTATHMLEGTQVLVAIDRLRPEPELALRATMLHELGHIHLGTDGHLDDERALMFWAPTVAHLSDADRRAVLLSRQP
jgi:hypothetical protein